MAIDGLVDESNGNQAEHFTPENPELLEMLAGYIAYRMKKKFPEKANVYGNLTKLIPFAGKNWMEAISRGSLMRPTPECTKLVSLMEEEFHKFHGTSVNKSEKVFQMLKNQIKDKYPEIDDFMAICFVRTRTFIRIKALNKRASKKWPGAKRNTSQERQRAKKMKKITV